MIELRDYQQHAIQATYDWMQKRDGNPLIVMPTGTGKSVVLAAIAGDAVWNWPETRILILSHVRELLQQDYASLLRLWPDAPAGLYSAGLGKKEIQAQILVAGIQSIHRHAYAVQRCDFVLIDEAHMIGRNEAGMYQRFLADMRAINPQLRVVGLTATPYRLDSGLLYEPYGDDQALFDGVAYEVPLLEMVKQGYLAEVRTKSTKTKLDVSGVGTRGGEFIASQLEAAVDIESVTEAAVDEIVRRGEDRGSWLIFCSGVDHAMHVRDAVRKWSISCEMVTGETPSVERDRIIADFRNGDLQAITNMNTLTTGLDVPGVDLIAMLRPTKSLGLYIQMVGRGMRTTEGKEDCLLLDFAGNARRFGPIDYADGRKKKGEKDDTFSAKVCPDCQAILHANTLECKDCGHTWPAPERAPPKIDRRAAEEAPVLSIHQTEKWLDVTEITYGRHIKEGKPDSMVVNYHCGLIRHREWIAFEHSGFPRQKAVSWWLRRSPSTPVPLTTTDALARTDEIAEPKAISVRPSGKYFEIAGVRFA